MSQPVPIIYLLHGDDEFAIAQFVSEIESKLGDPAMVAMNLTRLDGRSFNPDELLSVAGAMPFLADRRVVIVTDFLEKLTRKPEREHFLERLEKVPETTALLLVNHQLLDDDYIRRRNRGKVHWLVAWAEAHPERVFLRAFPMPKGAAMIKRIQELAQGAGGQFTYPAAEMLSSLIGDDPRLADGEVRKLLAYANYQRPVEPDDVQLLTADAGQGDIFALVDALGLGQGRQALAMLHRLLEQQDAFSIFGMIVRQFRLLLLAREVIDGGGRENDVAREVKVHPFVARKLVGQVRRYKLADLEQIYFKLLDLDAKMKTSQIPSELALDTLIVGLTALN